MERLVDFFYPSVDLAFAYHLIVGNLVISIFVLIAVFLIVWFKLHIKLFDFLSKFSKNYSQGIKIFLIIVFLITLGIYGFFQYQIYELDKSTLVEVSDKIVIIEIDDYWNIQDALPYFEEYGYAMERYRKVSDVLDRHGAVATLGVTPYIFVEDIREDLPLEHDQEMINYLLELKEKGYEIGMHGYNHCRNAYYCPQYEEVWFNVRQGKEILENMFDIKLISYFPPGNYWTTPQYENVKRAGFKVIGNTHVPHAYFDEDVVITQRGYDPLYVYRWYDKDFRHTSTEDWIEVYEKKDPFILQLHCNTFDSQEKLDDLEDFLEYVLEDGAIVMTYEDFYNYLQEGK